MSEKMAIDLNTLDTRKACAAGAVLDVKHPDNSGQSVGIKITLLGADSEQFTKARNKAVAARTNANLTPAAIKRQRQGRPVEVTEEDIANQDADGIAILAAVTVAWEGFVLDGKNVPCNPANAAMIYERFPWIKEQVDAFVNERSNFLAG